MNSLNLGRLLALSAAMCLSFPVLAQDAPKETPPPASTREEREAIAKEKLEAKKAEVAELKAKAKDVTKAIGKLAESGDLPTNQEGLAVMRQMLETLQDINDRLERLESEMKDLQGWVEGQNESQPVIAFELAEARRFRPSFYTQFQYRNSDRQVETAATRPSFFGTPFSGGRESAFAFRRLRFGAQYTVDPRTSIRFSFDAAQGTNTESFQLRDAQLNYVLQPSDTFFSTEVIAGQFVLPLGFELERSSGDREMPERAQYNRIMMNGERVRGAMIRHPLSNTIVATVGASSSLTFNDAEQAPRASTPEGRLAVFGAVRYETPTISAGISHFEGDRPSFRTAGSTGTATVGTVTVVTAPVRLSAPEIRRKFTYLDASLVGFLDPNLTLRFEGMRGQDRIPIANTQNAGGGSDAARMDADNMSGYQFQALYNVSPRLQAFGRFESFDPDTAQVDDCITGFGGGVRYFINPGASLAFSVERFRVPQFTVRKNHTVYTWRYQFRF